MSSFILTPLNRSRRSCGIQSQTLKRLFISCSRTQRREGYFSRQEILPNTVGINKKHFYVCDCHGSPFLFFQEVFPIHYGQQYEATLHSLVWKFVSRLDHLLPVPDIKQVLCMFKSHNWLCLKLLSTIFENKKQPGNDRLCCINVFGCS